MLYNKSHLSQVPLNTAGKITVLTAVLGLAVFSAAFLLNLGSTELQKAAAQSNATTTVTVLNTPPQWTINAQEEFETSTNTPTNSGDEVSWVATATDGNGADYYLIICSGTSTPTAPTANSSAPPTCANGQTQWAVSPAASSSAQARAATTTTEATPFNASESHDWYAWVCDGDASPRCNADFRQGSSTTASPFVVNNRPSFSVYVDDSPTDPGSVVTFTATASDGDTLGTPDTVQLHVCTTAAFSTTTNTCTASTIATSTFAASNPQASTTIVIPTQDDDYTAFGFVVDNHGHEASGGAQGTDSVLTVNNVAPTVASSTIVLNGGLNMVLTQEAAETTGFTLDFTVTDNNSCQQALSAGGGDEVVDYTASVYRSGVGSTTCNGSVGSYNPNNCYPSDLPTATWNLVCTASSTTCGGSTDADQLWECTFPLWYIADPTDGTATSTQFNTQDWRAAISPIDDDNASTTMVESGTSDIEVQSFLAFALDTLAIAYPALEPGQNTPTTNSTTTIRATGNVGLDQGIRGESMCGTYTNAVKCPNSASSTIPESEQRYATSAVAFLSGTALSSSTPEAELEVNIGKSTATSSQEAGDTFWGIAVPISITLAGAYTGENTFTAIVGESSDW